MKPRILWNAKDHPKLCSGYAIVGHYLLPLLAERYGHENVLIYAPVYERDATSEWDGMKVLSGTSWDFGEDMVLEHYQREKCNILLQVGDAWPLGIVPDLAAKDEIDWVHWLPVDWLGMPKNIQNRIRSAHKLIPFSKYGENALHKANFTNVEPAIWLGLDTDLWKPQPREELPDMMNLLGFEYNTFNLLIMAANQERKNIHEQLEGIRLFHQVNPQVPVKLYLHTQMRRERDLYADIDELGIGEIITYPDPYIMKMGGVGEKEMVMIFNCADVLLNACMEGFGLGMTQAQACGVPVVYLLEGPGPELVVHGVGVPAMANITYPSEMTKPIPNPIAVAHALEELWNRQAQNKRPLRSEKSIQFVQENFSWKRIAEQWFKVIDRVMWEKERYCYDIPEPSESLMERAKGEVVLR